MTPEHEQVSEDRSGRGRTDADGAAREPTAPVVPGGRRPHLDGVRTVAVYLVVAFHAGITRFAGGHIGVDVFFVLSGYLVTGVLLRELTRDDRGGTGRIRFGRFYARRARRLLPAAIIALIATAIAYRSIASSIAVLEAERGFQAAAVYLTNWYLIDNATSYFAVDTDHSPILHFWSLAVEEQFYLLWPLLFAGLVTAARRLGRHRWNAVRATVAVAGIASVTWAWSLRATDPNRAYYGTDTRAYQLLLGAILALSPWVITKLRRLGWLNAVLAGSGLTALVAVTIWGSRVGPVARGIAAALATVVIIAALETGRTGPVGRLLAWQPIEYLGQISYGTYLWHWPVIVIAQLLDPDLSPLSLAVLATVLATGIASLSYQLVEHPIRAARRLDRIAWPVAISGLAVSLIAGLLLLPQLLTDPRSSTDSTTADTAAILDRYTPLPAGFDAADVYFDGYGDAPRCIDIPLDDCIVVDSNGPTVVLMGDSNAQMWIPAFAEAAHLLDFRLYVLLDDGCSWQRGIYIQNDEVNERCRRLKDVAYEEQLPQINPDLLVLANAKEWRGPNEFNPDFHAHPRAIDETHSSLDVLETLADRILVVEHIPRPVDPDFEPRNCLDEERVIEACRFVVPAKPDFLEVELRRLAHERENLTSADFDRLACPFLPICDAMIGGTTVYWNQSHLTKEWTESLGDEIADYLVRERLISDG